MVLVLEDSPEPGLEDSPAMVLVLEDSPEPGLEDSPAMDLVLEDSPEPGLEGSPAPVLVLKHGRSPRNRCSMCANVRILADNHRTGPPEKAHSHTAGNNPNSKAPSDSTVFLRVPKLCPSHCLGANHQAGLLHLASPDTEHMARPQS